MQTCGTGSHKELGRDVGAKRRDLEVRGSHKGREEHKEQGEGCKDQGAKRGEEGGDQRRGSDMSDDERVSRSNGCGVRSSGDEVDVTTSFLTSRRTDTQAPQTLVTDWRYFGVIVAGSGTGGRSSPTQTEEIQGELQSRRT